MKKRQNHSNQTRNSVFLKWKEFTLLAVFTVLVSAMTMGQNILLNDGFNGSSSLFTTTGGTYYSTNSGTGDRPASTAFYSEGTAALGVSAGTMVMTSQNFNSSNWCTGQLSFRVGAWSIGSATNGMDAGDNVVVEVSPDGGTTYFNTLTLNGNNNAYWSYSGGNGNASTAYDGNTTTVNVTPGGGGARTSDGYSTMTVTNLPKVSNLKVRITAVNNTGSELWTIDDFRLTSSPSLTWVNTQFPGTGSICEGQTFTAYGQLWLSGLTQAVGAGPGVTVQLGYSTTNTTPASWTNWVNGTYNMDVGSNDEYKATLSGLTPGTYYYAFRFVYSGCEQYGGYSSNGGGFWNGTTYNSGILTVGTGLTLSSAAGTNTQTVCPNTAITNITFNLPAGATGTSVTGLPSGVTSSVAGSVLTISGTPTTSGTYNYSVSTTGTCGALTNSGTITVSQMVDWGNLQSPATGTACQNGTFNVYGRVYELGVTEAAGQGAGITVELGYNSTNTNPNTWAAGNWVAASFNVQAGNNDEYMASLPTTTAGTFYYAFRYRMNGCAWQYGGYNATGGGFWDGTNNVNGSVTITTSVTPSVVVTSSDADNSICSGTSVTFTAALTNGGSTPSYQWKLNGANVGTNSTTYTNAALTNGAIVTVVMTANNTCQTAASANGNSITTAVLSNVSPSVVVTSSAAGNSACAGASVTFTATPTNGGTTPAYQWKLNGANVGTNSASYTNATLANNDVVTVVLTSNYACLSTTTANGNSITTTVVANVTPAVAVTSSDADNSICTGNSVTFTATPTNGGTTPAYQWKLNGANVGTNSATYTNAALANSDAVTVVMTANNACQTSATANGNSISTAVSANVTPSVTIASGLTTATGSVAYNMNTANATTLTNVTVSALTQVNSFGVVAMLNGTSVSTGYTGASGGNNASIATNSTTLNTGTTSYFQFSITAATNYDVALTGISFGSRSTTTGPTAYVLRCSADGYATNLATGTFVTNSTWALFNNTIQSVLANTGLNGTTTFRIYGYASSGTGASGTANWRLDDITLNLAVTAAGCTNTATTFTATPTNGGSAPAYQWTVNGTNAGTSSATFAPTTLANGAVVACTMTANNACQTAATASSNSVEVPLVTTVTPSVAVTSNAAGNTICAGASVTFTATPTNGGTTPTYQWTLNGTNVGTNATTYTTAALASGDVVTVSMTTTNYCQSASSVNGNSITTTVNPNVTPSVAVTSSDADNTFCAGTSVTFTAAPTNGGTAPSYQWKLNGANVETNSTTYTNAALTNGAIVTVVMTANNACQTTATANGNSITNVVTANVTPAVAVTSSAAGNTICTGTSVTFTAAPTNGGSTPSYQWKLNGVNVGTDATTYTNAALTNGAVVTVVMTANNTCQTTSNANGNNITTTVINYVTPAVAITSNAAGNSICAGTSVTFTASPTNGGTTPAYQWKLNGVNAGTNGTTYTSTTLANNDVVTVVMTANNTCQTANTANANNITTTVTSNVTPAVAIGASTASVAGEVIWNMTTAAPSTTTTTGVTLSNISVGNSNNPATNFLDNVNPSSGYTGASAGNSMALADGGGALSTANGGSVYFQFTVTPQSGYWFSLNSIGFGSRSSNGNGGPTNFVLMSSADNYATAIYTGALNANSAWDYISFGINNALANSSSPITFRIYGYNGTNNTNSINWRVDDLLLDITTNTLTTTTSPSYCNGATPLFIAGPTNGGTTPSYQWRVNGVNVGTNSDTYANPNLVNGDVVSVVMTANNACQTAATATSNNVTVSILSSVLTATGAANCGSGTVTLSASSSCALPGSSIAWYAAATGGSALATGSTYTTTAATSATFYAQENFVGGEINYGNSSSATTNRGLQFNLNAAILLNSVNIESSGATAITIQLWNATTNAAMVIGGNTMSINQNLVTGNNLVTLGWNIPVGTGYRLVVTANSTGANLTRTTTYLFPQSLTGVGMITGNVDTGGANRYNFFYNWNYSTTRVPATITISTPVTPSVVVTSSDADNSICAGTSVTFTAAPTNGGTTPSYQWKLNGTNVGTNSATYVNAALVNNDAVTVVMTANNACQSTATANGNSITTTVLNNVTPAVAIASSDADNSICSGTSVTFTATPTNGGSTPAYQWKLNGTNVGTNSATYTNTALANGAAVTVVMTANNACQTAATANGNSITTTVVNNLTPAVAIASSDADNSICQGTSVTFTATPTNGGSTPAYQWKLNGTSVGTNSATYTNAALTTGAAVTVVMTANNVCQTTATANGNNITTTVVNNVTPAVSVVSSDADNSICSGASVTFTATPTNGGTTPAYQWKLNGTNVGTNGTTYTSTTLANSDIVSVVLTANNVCQTSATANGNNITTTVLNNLTPSVVIASSDADNSICSGTSVTFTATPTNGGTTPAYQWQLNGTNVGTNSATYINSTLATGDLVKVTMTANNVCQTTLTANASGITTTVTHTVTPAIAITSSDVDNSICAGASVTFTAAPTNGGSAPAYQWTLNGSNVGSNSTTFSSSSLSNNDVVSVVMTANNTCQTSATANANNITTAVLTNSNYYADADGDTYGPTASLVATCIMPAGYTTESGDCDDSNPDAYPYNLEICNSIDDDCDGTADNGLTSFTFHADVDGDGYGSNTAVVTYCDFVVGYILTGGDCNDNNVNVSPNASELCSTAFDDDCDGLINEVCTVTNDEPLFSAMITPATSLVSCNSVSGNLNGASPSSQVGVETLTGSNPDTWFYFTAASPGITIRCIPTANDVALELRTGAGLLVKSANAVTGTGDEYLNFGGLSIGSQYYVRVLQQDIANVGAAFTLCSRRLTANSNLNYTNAIIYDSGCDMVYATNATGTSACSIQLTPIAPAGGPVLTAQGSTVPLSSFVGTSGQRVHYNTTYSALITLTYSLPLGNGGTENISVSNPSTSNLTVVQHTDLDLGSVHSCPNKVVIGGTIRATTWLCDAYRYQWKFEKTVNGVLQLVNGNPVVIEVFGPVGTRDFIPTATMGFTSGSEWRVQIRPIFANGVVGSYGDDYQCMLFKGTAAAMPTAENAIDLEKSMEVESSDMTFMAYPNPSYNGELNVSWTVGEEVESAQMVVMDQQGRLVYTMNLNAAGFASINTSEWEAGIYHIRMSQGGTTTVKRWMKI